MPDLKQALEIRRSEDIVAVRQKARALSSEAGLKLVDETKMITAASEIARNTLIYGGGGVARFELITDGKRRGVRITFEDNGPGIADIALAMKDGYTTGVGLGLGLGGAKRLSSEFDIWSKPGEGTRITITRWQ